MNENITWNIAALYVYDKYMFSIIDEFKRQKRKIPFNYVFGGPPNCKWHGGRSMGRNKYSIPNQEKIIEEYNKRGIGCRFTFSYYDITEEDLNDPVGNHILNYANYLSSVYNVKNGVIISSDLLYDHIKERYTNLELICSLVKPTMESECWKLDTPEYYNNLCKKYDIVVINPARLIYDDFLEKLEDKSKIEIITNVECQRFCPNQANHYIVQWNLDQKINSGQNFSKEKTDIMNMFKKCNLVNNMVSDPMIVSEQLFNHLISMGFTNFKLQGRDRNINIMDKWFRQFICKDEVAKLILTKALNEA